MILMAWNTIFCFQGTLNASAWRVDEIRALFPTVDHVEDRRRITRIHKIVLRIRHLDLEKELLRDRSMIDQMDEDGRTALSWAAAREISKSVEALLHHGACSDIPDRIGQGASPSGNEGPRLDPAQNFFSLTAPRLSTSNWK